MTKLILEKTLNKNEDLFLNIKDSLKDLLIILNIENWEEIREEIYNDFNSDTEETYKYKNKYKSFEFKINTTIIEEGFENNKYYCIYKIIITTIIK